jgi:hypothetical protein
MDEPLRIAPREAGASPEIVDSECFQENEPRESRGRYPVVTRRSSLFIRASELGLRGRTQETTDLNSSGDFACVWQPRKAGTDAT